MTTVISCELIQASATAIFFQAVGFFIVVCCLIKIIPGMLEEEAQ